MGMIVDVPPSVTPREVQTMSHRLSRPLLATAIALGLAASAGSRASAQAATVIAGHVVSKTGAAIAGATIVVEGTQIGTLSATDGRYTLTVPGRTGVATLSTR